MNFPGELKYTEDHEWLRIEEDGTITIGITDFAQSELGDIVYVEIDTIDQDVAAGEIFGTVEAVKTVSELFMPVTGTVIEFNEELENAPEQVNDDPYGSGWLIKARLSDGVSIDGLLSSQQYAEMVAG
jgi:glycine cleavage system H protein